MKHKKNIDKFLHISGPAESPFALYAQAVEHFISNDYKVLQKTSYSTVMLKDDNYILVVQDTADKCFAVTLSQDIFTT